MTGDTKTLRDEFAMAALSVVGQRAGTPPQQYEMADEAYRLADAMMEARKTLPGDPLGRDSRGVSRKMRSYLSGGATA